MLLLRMRALPIFVHSVRRETRNPATQRVEDHKKSERPEKNVSTSSATVSGVSETASFTPFMLDDFSNALSLETLKLGVSTLVSRLTIPRAARLCV